ncbi:AtpZ/AtpI family protein [Flavobacterium sp.]|jgi:F0F1-type ATP synthase assembly protein I|uniref:AtpZ/AtpI family protein n=1 Tax=Flavobacterium sp. TaxID=239 RepID=UPI0033405261
MQNNKNKPLNKWIQFITMPSQMGVIIFIGVYVGLKLDEFYKNENLFTVIFSLISVFIALYVVIKNLNNLNKND